jgi:hypothetical protein
MLMHVMIEKQENLFEIKINIFEKFVFINDKQKFSKFDLSIFDTSAVKRRRESNTREFIREFILKNIVQTSSTFIYSNMAIKISPERSSKRDI